jgi:beta-glucanase (GH16 family)
MEWTEDYIEFYVDGEKACIFRKSDDPEDQTESAWPFDQPFYLIMNIAVGGGLGGEIDESALPYCMDVKHVKI